MKHTTQLKTYWAQLGFGGGPRNDLQVAQRKILLDTVVAQWLNGNAPVTQDSLATLHWEMVLCLSSFWARAFRLVCSQRWAPFLRCPWFLWGFCSQWLESLLQRIIPILTFLSERLMDRSFLTCLSGHLPFFRITCCCCRSPGQGMPSVIDIMQYVLCVGYLWLPLSTLHIKECLWL